jgi:hypothetical protein
MTRITIATMIARPPTIINPRFTKETPIVLTDLGASIGRTKAPVTISKTPSTRIYHTRFFMIHLRGRNHDYYKTFPDGVNSGQKWLVVW